MERIGVKGIWIQILDLSIASFVSLNNSGIFSSASVSSQKSRAGNTFCEDGLG
jgi:hypothetical protein